MFCDSDLKDHSDKKNLQININTSVENSANNSKDELKKWSPLDSNKFPFSSASISTQYTKSPKMINPTENIESDCQQNSFLRVLYGQNYLN